MKPQLGEETAHVQGAKVSPILLDRITSFPLKIATSLTFVIMISLLFFKLLLSPYVLLNKTVRFCLLRAAYQWTFNSVFVSCSFCSIFCEIHPYLCRWLQLLSSPSMLGGRSGCFSFAHGYCEHSQIDPGPQMYRSICL